MGNVNASVAQGILKKTTYKLGSSRKDSAGMLKAAKKMVGKAVRSDTTGGKNGQRVLQSVVLAMVNKYNQAVQKHGEDDKHVQKLKTRIKDLMTKGLSVVDKKHTFGPNETQSVPFKFDANDCLSIEKRELSEFVQGESGDAAFFKKIKDENPTLFQSNTAGEVDDSAPEPPPRNAFNRGFPGAPVTRSRMALPGQYQPDSDGVIAAADARTSRGSLVLMGAVDDDSLPTVEESSTDTLKGPLAEEYEKFPFKGNIVGMLINQDFPEHQERYPLLCAAYKEYEELQARTAGIDPNTYIPVKDSNGKTVSVDNVFLRYANIIPAEKTIAHAVYTGPDGSQFQQPCHANQVSDGVLAAGGPTKGGVALFLLMALQNGVKTIAMTTGFVEGGRTKCEQYLPKDPVAVEGRPFTATDDEGFTLFEDAAPEETHNLISDEIGWIQETDTVRPNTTDRIIGDVKVKLTGKKDSTDTYTVIGEDESGIEIFAPVYTIRKMEITGQNTSGQEETAEIKHVFFNDWPDHGVPKTKEGSIDVGRLVTFTKAIRKLKAEHGGKLMVHCSAGVGRTGTILSIDAMLEQLESAPTQAPSTTNDTVFGLREKRERQVVQTFEQYLAVDLAREALIEEAGSNESSIAVEILPAREKPEDIEDIHMNWEQLRQLRWGNAPDPIEDPFSEAPSETTRSSSPAPVLYLDSSLDEEFGFQGLTDAPEPDNIVTTKPTGVLEDKKYVTYSENGSEWVAYTQSGEVGIFFDEKTSSWFTYTGRPLEEYASDKKIHLQCVINLGSRKVQIGKHGYIHKEATTVTPPMFLDLSRTDSEVELEVETVEKTLKKSTQLTYLTYQDGNEFFLRTKAGKIEQVHYDRYIGWVLVNGGQKVTDFMSGSRA